MSEDEWPILLLSQLVQIQLLVPGLLSSLEQHVCIFFRPWFGRSHWLWSCPTNEGSQAVEAAKAPVQRGTFPVNVARWNPSSACAADTLNRETFFCREIRTERICSCWLEICCKEEGGSAGVSTLCTQNMKTWFHIVPRIFWSLCNQWSELVSEINSFHLSAKSVMWS